MVGLAHNNLSERWDNLLREFSLHVCVSKAKSWDIPCIIKNVIPQMWVTWLGAYFRKTPYFRISNEGDSEKRGWHEKIHVVIDAKYVIGLDNESGHVLGEGKTNLKII